MKEIRAFNHEIYCYDQYYDKRDEQTNNEVFVPNIVIEIKNSDNNGRNSPILIYSYQE
jgi:hypothetical protein